VQFFLASYVRSNSLVHKKAGLKAMIAISAAIHKHDEVVEDVCFDILEAVLVGVEDHTDPKARFAAIEALSMVCRNVEARLITHLNIIFESLISKICDSDDDVKGAAIHFNNQLKTHVN
jgi:hypothetical protein